MEDMTQAPPALTQAPPDVTPTPQINCQKAGCDKVYKARGSMMNHMRQKHSQGSAEIPSPLGSFPPASSATVLQFDDQEDATQGTSDGAVNSPKVVSRPTFICVVCDVHFPSKEDVLKHMEETHVTHDTTSNDNTFDNDNDEEVLLGEILDEAEADIYVRELEKMAFLFTTSDQNCHNCAMSKEVENHKEKKLKEKDSKIESMARRQKKTDEKKNELYKEKKKIVEENVALKKELKICQGLLAECQKRVTTMTAETATRADMDAVTDEGDKNHKIKCNHCNFIARNKHILEEHVRIKHGRSADSIRCTACDKVFSSNDDLEVHLVQVHTEEVDCSRCNAIFMNESDVYKHSNECSEVIGPNTCNKCERDVISRAALKKHERSCRVEKQIALCRNGESCRYYKANRCSFFHPEKRQHQQPNRRNNKLPIQRSQNQQPKRIQNHPPVQEQQNQWHTVQSKRRNPRWTCNHCDTNIYNQAASRSHSGSCRGMNRQSMNVSPHRGHSGRQQLWCKFQETCTKGQTCGYKHFQSFPMGNLPQGQH